MSHDYDPDTERPRTANFSEIRRSTRRSLKAQETFSPDLCRPRRQREAHNRREERLQGLHVQGDEHGGDSISEGDSDSDAAYSEESSEPPTDDEVRPADGDDSRAEGDEKNISSGKENPFITHKELEDKVDELKQRLAVYEERLNQTKMELALAQSRRPAEYDDYHFLNQIGMLRNKIRRWTASYFTCARGYITRYARRRFEKLSDDWAAYLDNETQRPRLIQARIWHKLLQHIFDAESEKRTPYIFAGNTKRYGVDEMLNQVSRYKNPQTRAPYIEWRMLTFTLLYPGKGDAVDPAPYLQDELNNRAKILFDILWRTSRPYVSNDLSKNAILEAQDTLRQIVTAAINLDLDIRKHSDDLDFFSDKCQVGSDFLPSHMDEIVNETGSGHARLIVSPPLYKIVYSQNSAGESKRILLLRAEVCSSTLERLPRHSFWKALDPLVTLETSRPKDDGDKLPHYTPNTGRLSKEYQRLDPRYEKAQNSRSHRRSQHTRDATRPSLDEDKRSHRDQSHARNSTARNTLIRVSSQESIIKDKSGRLAYTRSKR